MAAKTTAKARHRPVGFERGESGSTAASRMAAVAPIDMSGLIGYVLALLVYGVSIEIIGALDRRAAWMWVTIVSVVIAMQYPALLSNLTRIANQGKRIVK
jgi:uncharacterized membrane protein